MKLLHRIALSVPQLRQMHDTRDFLLGHAQRLEAELAQLRTGHETQAAELNDRREADSGDRDPPMQTELIELEARHRAEVADLQAQLSRLQAHPAVTSPFFHYNAAFDPQEVIQRHAAPEVHASPDHYVNFLGVKVRPEVFPSFLEAYRGVIEPIPIPANWHADIAEWGAALRAVDLARNTFTVIELGCGWGCWMNNTGTAARRAGLKVNVIGVEGDAGHIGFASNALADNGFAFQEVTLRHGVVAPTGGVAMFPRTEKPGDVYGSEPVFGATEEQQRAAAATNSHDILPMIALGELAAPYPRVDLLHIDIQGGEADFIQGCLPVMNEKVGYVVVGTHSRQLEGRIFDALLDAGWVLEIERPAIFTIVNGRPNIHIDGLQGWRNPRLVP